ncbi:MAG: glycosyltransferase family 2 protein [Bacteroidota bacterium]
MDINDFKKIYENKKVVENENKVIKTPMVSVCIQTYQHADYIQECLEGVLMQKTSFEIEILLGEDASKDSTREICIGYANRYPEKIRLFLHHRENNISIGGKPTGRFNFLYNLYSAKGKYTALCDGDDYWTDPFKLQKQVEFLEENEEYVISGHNAKIIDKNNNFLSSSKLPEVYQKDATCEELKRIYDILTLTMVFRNIPGVREFPEILSNTSNGDSCLISLLGNYGKYHYHQDIKPAVYRVHSGGVWSSLNQKTKYLKLRATFIALRNYYEQKGDNEMVSYYTHKVHLNKMKQFDHSMNNEKAIVKTKNYFISLFNTKNLINKKRFVYINKAYFKSLLSKK